MNTYHQEILSSIAGAPKKKLGYFNPEKYLGTPHKFYSLNSATTKKILSEFKKSHKELSLDEFYPLLDSLVNGESFEERVIAAGLLDKYSSHRNSLDLSKLEKWLEHLVGWAEVDSMCQSNFSGDEVIDRWDEWEELLNRLVKSDNISKRRASLVLLVRPTRELTDDRLMGISLKNIDLLKSEKEILITKAVSWLLRSMVKNYSEEVRNYLSENEDKLPKIAIRETRRKLETGRK